MKMLDYSSLDHGFKNEVTERAGGERVTNCFLCGTCTAGCPVSIADGSYNPRRIMRMLLLGMKKELLDSQEIWQCSQCHTCVAHCPQDVRFADVIRVLRQMAVEEGYISKELANNVEELDVDLKRQRIARINELFRR
jgi:heterodisulfide reductase subunit C2